MPKHFIRRVEDFTCEHCGARVTGNGYTNHCPQCLWSKHVDVVPGDRAAECQGMMEPVGVERKKDAYVILHRCVVCGHERKNSSVPGDNFEVILKLSVGNFSEF